MTRYIKYSVIYYKVNIFYTNQDVLTVVFPCFINKNIFCGQLAKCRNTPDSKIEHKNINLVAQFTTKKLMGVLTTDTIKILSHYTFSPMYVHNIRL